MSPISLLALENIKREAKKLKNQLPKLSHGQRLDIIARDLLKVRNYHEAKVQCKKHIHSQISENGGISKCSYCQFSFVVTEEGDFKAHEKFHLEYEKAEYTLGFLPAFLSDRENEKKKAYKELNTNDSFPIKLQGALRLIRAHFDRSLEAAIMGNYWRKHPSFEGYLAKIDDYTNIIPVEVMQEIRSKYGKDVDTIEEGKSYWYPPKG